MRINTKHRFVFISMPKVCTHTIYKMLDEYYADGLIEKGFHEVDIPEQYSRFFRWTVCRNPFARAVSLWWSGCRCHTPDIYGFRKGCGSADDFTTFVRWLSHTPVEARQREPLMLSQGERVYGLEPIVAVHLEHLERELTKLPFWKPGTKIKRLNTTEQKIKDQEREEQSVIAKPPWQEFYSDPLAREAVLKWSWVDFERFGYSTEIR